MRGCIGKQLEYVRKGLDRLEELKTQMPDAYDKKIPSWLKKRLETIPKVYEQQKYMYDSNTHSVDHRIVSLEQPHVRPIVRGKKPNPTEFGQKLHLSTAGGYTFLELTCRESFNESTDLETVVEDYRRKFGCYPESVLADKIYQTRANKKYCKGIGIRLSGKPLGRQKPEEKEKTSEQMYKDSCERNAIECKNGSLKRRYGLDQVMSKLDETAKTEVVFALIVMNSVHKYFWQFWDIIFESYKIQFNKIYTYMFGSLNSLSARYIA